jgi:3-hydroxyisobutyrate dehydrogenase
MAKIAFLGLGVMGSPMAGHLQLNGHEVTVYNRSKEKAEKWHAKYGGQTALTPKFAAQDAEFVISCVGNDDDLRSVVLGKDGALAGMAKGSVYIDHTTVSANVTSELYDLSEKQNISFVDAPISGGQAGAENGVLSIMCGGDQDTYDRAEPVMSTYARICRRIGETGTGQKTKMCNQIAIAGLDGRAVIEVIAQGAAGSWQMSNRYETMLEDHFEHGFAVDWMRKDLAICLSASDEVGASLPITALVDQFYKDIQNMGGGRWDTSSLFKRLANLS